MEKSWRCVFEFLWEPCIIKHLTMNSFMFKEYVRQMGQRFKSVAGILIFYGKKCSINRYLMNVTKKLHIIYIWI